MSQPPDILVPDPVVWREFNVTSMTGSRWTKDPTLNFPPPMKINGRNFRSRRQLEEFKARILREAIAARSARFATPSEASSVHEDVA
jgi:hypothetical protein